MSENVSSNVLFHFTRSMENLKSILQYGFRPRYCLEYTLAPIDQRRARRNPPLPPRSAIPMVCFCDLPLSLIRKHLDMYGGFGIGLGKSWGLRHGIEPVFYTHSKGQTRKPMARLTANAQKMNVGLSKDLALFAAYTKPYQGFAWRKGKVGHVRFYDEREWRYVPVSPPHLPTFLPWETFRQTAKRTRLQILLKMRHSLTICPDDVQYLIIPFDRDEQNIVDLHEHLKRIYPRKRDAVLVTTAIMTSDCIEEDI